MEGTGDISDIRQKEETLNDLVRKLKSEIKVFEAKYNKSELNSSVELMKLLEENESLKRETENELKELQDQSESNLALAQAQYDKDLKFAEALYKDTVTRLQIIHNEEIAGTSKQYQEEIDYLQTQLEEKVDYKQTEEIKQILLCFDRERKDLEMKVNKLDFIKICYEKENGYLKQEVQKMKIDLEHKKFYINDIDHQNELDAIKELFETGKKQDKEIIARLKKALVEIQEQSFDETLHLKQEIEDLKLYCDKLKKLIRKISIPKHSETSTDSKVNCQEELSSIKENLKNSEKFYESKVKKLQCRIEEQMKCFSELEDINKDLETENKELSFGASKGLF